MYSVRASTLRTAVVIVCLSYARALFITVDAHAEECFHDTATSGTKMGLTFEVAEGGFLDIDVKVGTPKHRTERPCVNGCAPRAGSVHGHCPCLTQPVQASPSTRYRPPAPFVVTHPLPCCWKIYQKSVTFHSFKSEQLFVKQCRC
ncbi:unnamed protein product [Ixodes pacificus]